MSDLKKEIRFKNLPLLYLQVPDIILILFSFHIKIRIILLS